MVQLVCVVDILSIGLGLWMILAFKAVKTHNFTIFLVFFKRFCF